ncbi:CrcB-like protein-domain-containing protein [Xylaria bambusicola]|uniref:CrcB-like protein-domain-containing protein n=1 Tax=Xylaria bambusicola TaxID=326684 RepID=UPI00200828E2|nr:CrcB-like protein-domain-containing protein [Xylaria bambusicola]KAI0502888.1 CrcB-like protein-domain-containing protein [Xylaria bambusicola]
MPSGLTRGTTLRSAPDQDATPSPRPNAQNDPSTGGPVQPIASPARRPSKTASGYEAPESYLNLPEVEDVPIIQDRNELSRLDSQSIEELASRLHADRAAPGTRRDLLGESQLPQGASPAQSPDDDADAVMAPLSQWATEFYTVSYLILFAILGTLARLGLQALTFYPGAAIPFSSVWPNFAGTLVIGFLTEDRMLFRYERDNMPISGQQSIMLKADDDVSGSPHAWRVAQDLAAAKKAHLSVKKTIPLYIGLATGFCGSFTSFSSFIRDIFLALSDDLPIPDGASTPRNGGYSFLALLAVTIGTISLSFSGFYLGAHLAEVLEPVTPSIRYPLSRKFLDPLAVVLGWGSWIGAVVLSIVPPDRYSNPGSSEFWRGRATFALVFAPLGCLARFYASARLNGRVAAFPLGTFAVNIAGTAILGVAWDLAHVPTGGVVGCQVLQGIQDGFCGCLTTVSTWVVELAVLGRRKAYVYGGASVITALVLLIAIMGGLRWSQGFSTLIVVTWVSSEAIWKGQVQKCRFASQ